MNYLELIYDSTLVAKAVLFALIIFSFLTWVLIVQKQILLIKIRRDTERFLKLFRSSGRLAKVKSTCDQHGTSPQVGLFKAGYSELNYQWKHQSTTSESGKVIVRSLESVNRVLQRASFVEIAKMEKNLNHLATTAAVAPFVGLLGTVWGIIEAFADIADQKSASLAVVAPGIANALIATAFGLFAAIPAVMAYNYFVNKVRGLAAEMEDFSLEFLGIVEKNFT